MSKRNQKKANTVDLRRLYEEYVDGLADSGEHKAYLLRSDKCFAEWCEEREAGGV